MKMESSNVRVLPNYMKEFAASRFKAVRKALAEWYRVHQRDLAWRRNQDPYRIWISEIMLQQTRVAAVIPYYERFLARFPDVAALAGAGDDDLLTAWAGLGYYSRARNLRAAARLIVENGQFPDTYDDILALPGVGPYTAAAVGSISFGLPFAVLDGNVMRVLTRLTRDDGDIASGETKKRLQGVAQNLLDRADPAQHNQAVMELGAMVCTPRDPKCGMCPVVAYCEARKVGLERELPVKRRTDESHRIRRTLLVVIRNGYILLWQRAHDARMLGGFWELPEPDQLPAASSFRFSHQFSHAITNHLYEIEVVEADAARAPRSLQWVALSDLSTFPLSTIARKALKTRLPERLVKAM